MSNETRLCHNKHITYWQSQCFHEDVVLNGNANEIMQVLQCPTVRFGILARFCSSPDEQLSKMAEKQYVKYCKINNIGNWDTGDIAWGVK